MADASIRTESNHVKHRATHAGASSPALYTEIDDEVDLRHLFTEYDDSLNQNGKKLGLQSTVFFWN